MSFVKRKIKIQMVLNGDTFDNGANTITLEGMRTRISVVSTVGGVTPAMSKMELQVWGMKPSDLARISTLGMKMLENNPTLISVKAGDDKGGMSLVFLGAIAFANIDYNAMPDVCLEIQANTTYNYQIQPMAGTSYPGRVSASTLLKAICAACKPPLNFADPKGFDGQLSNHAVAGSPFWQIADICGAAGCNWTISNGTLTIWPTNTFIDDSPILVSSGRGLVGYPCYSNGGIDVVMEYNPSVMLGRKIQIQTDMPQPTAKRLSEVNKQSPTPLVSGSNGTFGISMVSHDLSSELPGGPWFTKAWVTQILAREFS